MIIMSKEMIPMDIDGYNKVLGEYRESLNWKINFHMDGIANNRAAVADREAANMRKKNPALLINNSMKANKESQVLKTHD